MKVEHCDICGEELSLSSHYHCPNCLERCSMMGHSAPGGGYKCERHLNADKVAAEWAARDTADAESVDAAYGDTAGKRCSACHAPVNKIDGSWRFNGSEWEHKCPDAHPQCGHFVAEDVPAPPAWPGYDVGTVAMPEVNISAMAMLVGVARMAMIPERDAHDQYGPWHERLRREAQAALAAVAGAVAMLVMLAGCEAVNVPRDPWAMPVRESVYVVDAPPQPEREAAEPVDDGTPLWGLRNALGMIESKGATE